LAVEVVLVPIETEGVAYLAAFVRDARARRRNADHLDAVNQVTQLFLGETPVEEVLPLVVARARQLVGATAAWIAIEARSGELLVEAADGEGTAMLLGLELSAGSNGGTEALVTGRSLQVEDLATTAGSPEFAVERGLGSAVFVPLAAGDRRNGVLVAARARGGGCFSVLEVELLEVFAGATAVAIALGEARNELDRLEVVEEDERIARELHDTVIQRLFALGMSLQATRNTVVGPTADRIDSAVGDLDEVIREIRDTVFRLPGRSGEVRELRDEIFRVGDRFTADLGFTPRIAFRGPSDVIVPDLVVANLLRVYAELLANIARHARASAADAVVTVESGWLQLSVEDDGVGFRAGPATGRGLRNVAARATDLGGTFNATRRQPSGTVIDWRVPL
jgi:signal transduction histidine kinase